MKQGRFVLIDAFALIFRAYHALPPMTNGHGVQLNAVYGFTSALLSAIKELQPEYLAVGFDLAKPTKRHVEFKDYKAHRPPAPPELSAQIPYVKELLQTFNIPTIEKEGYEGEDVIATIIANCKQLTANSFESKKPSAVSSQPQANLEFIIVTGDMDTLQLIDNQTKVYSMARGANQAVMYDIDKVKERYGLTPSQFVDFKALKGDASDNIPGVPGIGEKGAAKLIAEYGSLEKIYQNLEKISEKYQKILKENKEQAFLSQKLSKIVDNAPIEFELADAKIHDYNQKKVIELFEKYGFRSLIKRLHDSHRPPSGQQKLL